MNTRLMRDLLKCETDVEGSLKRFSGNEDLYISYVGEFPADPSMQMIKEAVEEQNWEEAFSAAHALKGLAGNLGFIPLYHAVAQMVVMLRAKKLEEAQIAFEQAKVSYDLIVDAIRDGIDMKGWE